MKKTIAVILSLVMLFSLFAINTFAAGTPTVKVITNEGSPITSGSTTYFTVKFSNFESIQGMDITITADATAKLTKDLSVTNFGITLKENENYTFSESKIHIVDLTGGKSGTIVFKATNVTADAKITVSGQYAESGETLFDIDAVDGKIEIVKPAPTKTQVTGNSVLQPDNKNTFIPYGSVWKEDANGKITYAPKNENGTFTGVDSTYSSKTFTVPAGGIGAFATSQPVDPNKQAVKFNNYSNKNKAGVTHGTMVFEGDWKSLKEYYIKKGYTVEEILNMFSKSYDANIKTGNTHVYYKLPVGGETKTIRLYKFAQEKYMWKNGDVLEYAIVLNNAQNDTDYTAVAYCVDGSNTTLASSVMTIRYTAAN